MMNAHRPIYTFTLGNSVVFLYTASRVDLSCAFELMWCAALGIVQLVDPLLVIFKSNAGLSGS